MCCPWMGRGPSVREVGAKDGRRVPELSEEVCGRPQVSGGTLGC